MISSKFMRTTLVLAVAAVAAAANAQISLFSVSNGSLQFGVPAGSDTATETVDAMVGGYGPLTVDTWTVGQLAVAGNFVGSITYSGPGGTLTAAFTLPSTNSVFSNGSFSYDGTWTYTSGTGTYANQMGGGTIAINLIDINGTDYTGTGLSGTLSAVPEPAPSAVIGAGVLGLCLVRRRKR